MNNNSNKPPTPGSAEQAINRILEAERETGRAITDCERQAHDILQAARQRARRVLGRTDDRISLMKMKTAQRVSTTIQSMDREQEKARHESARPLDETGLADCIEQVACLLSGGTPEHDEGGDPGE